MPMPSEYQRASLEFEKFLVDAREASGLTTTNQVYTMVQGVLQTFRRRLTLPEAIQFAGVLPAVLRALFVADWIPNEPRRSFGNTASQHWRERAEMTQEVQSLRADHNFAPDIAIQAVAIALRKNIDETKLDGVLSVLPTPAHDFWSYYPN